MDDFTSDSQIDASGILVQEIEADERFEPITPDGNQRWHGQLRRSGSARELPGPQRYLDYPTWLTAPNKNPALELEQTPA
jgi:hypothetical protein